MFNSVFTIYAKDNISCDKVKNDVTIDYNLFKELTDKIDIFNNNIDFRRDNIEYDNIKTEYYKLISDIESLKNYSKEELINFGFDAKLSERIVSEEFDEDLLYAASPQIQITINQPSKTYSSSTNKSTISITAGFTYSNYITGSTFSKHNFGISSFCYASNGNTPIPDNMSNYSGTVTYMYTDNYGNIQYTYKTIPSSNKSCDQGCARFAFTSAIATAGSLGHVRSGTFTINYTISGNISRIKATPAYGYTTTGANTFNIASGIMAGIVEAYSQNYIDAILAFTSIPGNSTQILGNTQANFYV